MSEERAIAFVNRNHPHNDKDDFRTPQYLFSYIVDRYSIEYDGACTPGVNNLAQLFLVSEITCLEVIPSSNFI